MFEELIKSFITLLIIVDPFISAGVFIAYCKDASEKEKSKALWTAVLVAAALLFIFLFIGLFVLNALGITLNGLRVGGGIILLLMGVSSVLGIEFHKKKEIRSAAILIGTPLLAGPGALTTIIILSNDYGYLIPAIATLAVVIVSYLILRYADKIAHVLGTEMIEIFSKIFGLLLSALAIDFIHAGIAGFISGG